MVRTSNERISADTGHGCCLRGQASIRARQHARKSARIGKHFMRQSNAPRPNHSRNWRASRVAHLRLQGMWSCIHGKRGTGGVAREYQTFLTPEERDKPIPFDAKNIVVEFEVDYDTIPETGNRKSYKEITFPINWANGQNNRPLLESKTTAEREE
jgi:hypothetical protein